MSVSFCVWVCIRMLTRTTHTTQSHADPHTLTNTDTRVYMYLCVCYRPIYTYMNMCAGAVQR